MRIARAHNFALVAALAFTALSPARAASTLALDVTGQFGPTTTLNGTALGANTPFAFHAAFDPADDVNSTLR